MLGLPPTHWHYNTNFLGFHGGGGGGGGGGGVVMVGGG